MAGFGVLLSEATREGLEALVRAGNTAQKLAQRARIGLMASQGHSDSEIGRKLEINRKTVAVWRQRTAGVGVQEGGDAKVAGQVAAEPGTQPPVTPPGAKPKSVSESAAERLRDRRSSQRRKRVLTPEMVERIVHTTVKEKPEGRTHWATRSLAKHLGVSKMAVQRVWKAEKLKPHRMETFKFSKDKRFVEKLTDVVAIYQSLPAGSTVYCVDEKSQIQALDRTQPGLPWKKGKCGTRTHDYKRHGTTTLFAAYNVATGKVIGECHPRHSNQEFLCFLRCLDRETAPGSDIHIILDNAGYHNHENVKLWLGKHQRFHFHFIPTSSSWTNLVERWFGLLTDQCIRRGVFHSVKELQLTIYNYLKTYNIDPEPFHWRASVSEILEKIRRAAWVAGVTLSWNIPTVLTT
jgi:transposase